MPSREMIDTFFRKKEESGSAMEGVSDRERATSIHCPAAGYLLICKCEPPVEPTPVE